MKNKTIILGKSGSGKSFLAIKEVLNKKGFVAIFNGCINPKESYSKHFPELEEFLEINMRDLKSFPDTQCQKYLFDCDGSYLSNNVALAEERLRYQCVNFSYDNENTHLLYDDGAWCKKRNNALFELLFLSSVNCSVTITANELEDILFCDKGDITPAMFQLLKERWNIVYCDHSKGLEGEEYFYEQV